MLSIEERLAAIEARNAKVETDKAWETSWVRRGSIAFITYIVISLTLMVIGHDGAWIHSVIPVLGYLLSTLALPAIRKQWQKRLSIVVLLLLAPTFAQADISVAVPLPLSGSMASFGDEMRAGAELAVELINGSSGVAGENIKLDFIDDACSATQAVTVANKVVSNPPVAVLGPACSAATLASLSVYGEAGIPEITISSDPKVTDSGYKNVFRINGDSYQQGIDLAHYITKNVAKDARVAVLDDRGAWGVTFANTVAKTLKDGGVNVTKRDSLTAGDKDFSALLTSLKQNNITDVVLGVYVMEAALLTRQAHDMGYKANFYGGDAIQTPEFWKVAGPAAEGVRMSGAYDPGSTPNGRAYIAAVQKRNKPVGVYGYYAYASVQTLFDALKRAKSHKAADVVAAIHEGKADTLLGDVAFDSKGNLQNYHFQIFTWHNGAYTPVSE